MRPNVTVVINYKNSHSKEKKKMYLAAKDCPVEETPSLWSVKNIPVWFS